MKKIKFNFLSPLPFILIFGIFLVSSSTLEEAPQYLTVSEELVLEKGYLMPLEISNQTADYVENHISNISAELEMTYLNNHIVGQYLVHFGKANQVANSLSEKDNLSEIDLSKVLTEEELNIINSKLLKSLSAADGVDCVKNYVWNPCCWRDNGVCVGAWCGNGCYPANCGC